MLSIFYSNWITTYYNTVTLTNNFMQAKSNAKIETTLHAVTVCVPIWFGIIIFILNDDAGNVLKNMADSVSNKTDIDLFIRQFYFSLPIVFFITTTICIFTYLIHYCYVFKCAYIKNETSE